MASVFYSSKDTTVGQEVGALEHPGGKSIKEPPCAGIPAIEVFLNRVEKELFHTTRSNYVRKMKMKNYLKIKKRKHNKCLSIFKDQFSNFKQF